MIDKAENQAAVLSLITGQIKDQFVLQLLSLLSHTVSLQRGYSVSIKSLVTWIYFHDKHVVKGILQLLMLLISESMFTSDFCP